MKNRSSDPTEGRLQIFCHFGCPEHRGGNCTCRNQEALRHYRNLRKELERVRVKHNLLQIENRDLRRIVDDKT
jgi:hypothetical protein